MIDYCICARQNKFNVDFLWQTENSKSVTDKSDEHFDSTSLMQKQTTYADSISINFVGFLKNN